MRWYRLCFEDDILVQTFRPGYVTVAPYSWSVEGVWWDPSSKRRRRTAVIDESDMGPVPAEGDAGEPDEVPDGDADDDSDCPGDAPKDALLDPPLCYNSNVDNNDDYYD